MNAAVGPRGRSAAEEPERLAVAFARVLRAAGLPVASGAALRYAEALAAVGLGRPGPVYWAGRATLVHRTDDVPAYDEAFRTFWWHGGAVPLSPVSLPGADEVVEAEEDEDGPGAAEEPGEQVARVLELRYSRAEVLRQADFATCTPEELAEAYRLMDAIRVGPPRRPTRRRRPARRRGDRPDLRRTVRQALRTEGEPLRRRWLETTTRPRRVVVLCDVSGSMAPYTRALLRFAHVAVVAWRPVEVFTFGTRLTRLTRALSARDPDSALAAAWRAVPDLSGGTRLGEALREFNDRWGVRGLARGAVVVVLSDGWDRGDPAVLGAEMARLARVAHEVIWVNPLKASPGYAPLVRGMAAALPHVDHFVEGHSVASLEALARVVAHDRVPGRRGRIEARSPRHRTRSEEAVG